MNWFSKLLFNYMTKNVQFSSTAFADPFQFQPRNGNYGNNMVNLNSFEIRDMSYSENSKFEFEPVFPVVVKLKFSNICLFVWNEV